MTEDWADDEALARDLTTALREERDVPADFAAAGRAVFAWRDVDAELAALAQDTPALVRAGEPQRSLTFRTPQWTLEVDLEPAAVRGQLVPEPPLTLVAPVEVTMEGTGFPPDSVSADDLGYFSFGALPRHRFRLRCRTGDGTTFRTPWLDPR